MAVLELPLKLMLLVVATRVASPWAAPTAGVILLAGGHLEFRARWQVSLLGGQRVFGNSVFLVVVGRVRCQSRVTRAFNRVPRQLYVDLVVGKLQLQSELLALGHRSLLPCSPQHKMLGSWATKTLGSSGL